jgi:perosamine synthetase
MISNDLPAIAGGTPLRQVPLAYGRHQLEPNDLDAVDAALRSGSLTGGPAVIAFEEGLARECGADHAIAVSNGTAALHLALAALGVGTGDEVITTPLTFVASANSVLFTGATPVFADIGDDRNLDASSVATLVNDRTRAVLVVDYSGLPADVTALRSVLPDRVHVVVDAAHSLGCRRDGLPVASAGDVTTLSFHPVKHITTGEGGACLTSQDAVAERIGRLRNHGMTSVAAERTGRQWKYDVTALGYNYRLSDIQAALGRAQLNRLAAMVERRTELAARYDHLLMGVPGLGLPPRRMGAASAWHLYALEIDPDAFGLSRDHVIDALRAEGIQSTLHYPAAHLLTLYRNLGHRPGECPRAEELCDRLVTLPLFPSMTESDQDDVVRALQRLHAWAPQGGR